MADKTEGRRSSTVSTSARSPWSVTRRTFLATLGAAGVAGAAFAGGFTPTPEKSVTGFAGDGNPVDLLPRLSPPPGAVPGVARPSLDLNGTWRFNPAPPADFWKGVSDSGWSDITVPGEWVMQGFDVKPRQSAGYRLHFQSPADWAGHRAKIRFDAVYSKADMWMNGVPIGSHLGAFTPFELDATNALLPGKENVLALAVASDSLADALTVGLEMVGHPMGGIIRKASAFVVPPVNVSALHVTTAFDCEYRNATLHVLIDVANETGNKDPVSGGELAFTLREYGSSGTAVDLTPGTVKLPPIGLAEVLSQEIEIPIEAPKRWDAEHPNLYVLTCELKAAGHQYTTQRRFGFRQVEINDGVFLLNGRPIRLRGMSRQDAHPLTGRTISQEVHKQDIEWLRWANCNNTYTCAFLPDEESLNLCDEAGLYVMDEPGTCWVPGRAGLTYDDPKLFPYYLQPVLEMIARDRSHPSVITWMLCDESMYGRNFREVLKMTRAVDPSRPVHMAWDPGSGAEQIGLEPIHSPFDLGSWHYPTQKMFDHACQSKRPVVFDQSASAYFANVPELACDPGIRDEWGKEYAPFWEKLWEAKSILGGQVFNLTDDQYVIPSGLITGNGEWGFIDPWRRAKPDLYHVRKAHSPAKVEDAPLRIPAAGEPVTVPIENRYDFTNLSEIRIEWSLGDESGTAVADVPPHQKGTISIRPKSTNLRGKVLSLKFFRKGDLVDAYKLPLGPVAEPAPVAGSKGAKKVELAETATTITARGEGFEWVINRQTGEIIKATRHGQTVLVGGPQLMILPTKDYLMTPGFPEVRPQSFGIFNELCHDWKATSVSGKRVPGGVEVAVAGHYQEATGAYTIHIGGDGEAAVTYRFSHTGKEKISLRQLGMVLYAPRSCDALSWKRRAQWSVYPEDHIGRVEGVAKALPDPSLVAKAGNWMEVAYRQQPTWPWSQDANALGTRDFRATRMNILYASLKDSAGNGVTVLADGKQHTRSFLDGDRIGLLVACYSGPALNTSWLHGVAEIAGIAPRILEVGEEVKDTVRLLLTGA